MERVGLAASKMAQGNLLLYNFYVILISFLFSLFVFVVSGSSIAIALIIISYIINGITPPDFDSDSKAVLRICMISLTVIIGALNVFILSKNLRFRKRR